MADATKQLFTEAFRPKELSQVVLLPRIYNEVKNGLVQNIMLEGTPGTGKTTLTRILSEGYDKITINCSEERGIDVIRNKIIGFSSTLSLVGGRENMKVIILEECDGMTEDAWKALRAVIEQYADDVRFICNCNNVNKVPGPIQSRFNVVHCGPINKEEEVWLTDAYVAYVGQILNYVGIAYDEETLRQFVLVDFPDMRSIITNIQSLHLQGVTKLDPSAFNKTFDCGDLFEQIVSKCGPDETYKLIVGEYANRVQETMLSISKNFVEFVRLSHPELNGLIPMMIISIADYMHMLSCNPKDEVIVLNACVHKLKMVIEMGANA